eukprot:m.10117 g.10117  ORF g.10117 m.10117 type:complete len:432 (-) comp8133_c1_seq1:37-1332(-)
MNEDKMETLRQPISNVPLNGEPSPKVSMIAASPQQLELKPRDVNVHYTLGFLPAIITSEMVWHAQILIRGVWTVDQNDVDNVSALAAKPSEDDPNTTISEFDQLLVWKKQYEKAGKSIVQTKEHADNVIEFEEIFHPRFYLVNLLGNRFEAVQEYCVEVFNLSPTKLCCLYSLRVLGEFKTMMELRHYPFDHSTLEIELMSQWNSLTVTLLDQQAVNANRKNLLTETALKYSPVEWDIYDHALVSGNTEEGASVYTYDKVLVSVFIRRRPAFYILKIYLPNYVLVSISCLVLLMSTYDDQINMILSVLLTGSAYQIIIASSAPVGLPYNTNADLYIAMCIFYNVIILVMATVGVSPFGYKSLWLIPPDEFEDEERFSNHIPLRNLTLAVWAVWTAINLLWAVGTAVTSRSTKVLRPSKARNQGRKLESTRR